MFYPRVARRSCYFRPRLFSPSLRWQSTQQPLPSQPPKAQTNGTPNNGGIPSDSRHSWEDELGLITPKKDVPEKEAPPSAEASPTSSSTSAEDVSPPVAPETIAEHAQAEQVEGTRPLTTQSPSKKKGGPSPKVAYDTYATWSMHHIFCRSSRNNTMCTLTTREGRVLGHWSGGTVGFKKGARETHEAGYQCAIKSFEAAAALCKQNPKVRLGLIFTGFGAGREAFKSAVLTQEGEAIRDKIVYVQDRTPLKIGGTRGKKQARK